MSEALRVWLLCLEAIEAEILDRWEEDPVGSYLQLFAIIKLGKGKFICSCHNDKVAEVSGFENMAIQGYKDVINGDFLEITDGPRIELLYGRKAWEICQKF